MMCQLLLDFGIAGKKELIQLFKYNQRCIKLSVREGHTKHTDVKYHLFRDNKDQGLVQLEYCLAKEIIANALTKPLIRDEVEDL